MKNIFCYLLTIIFWGIGLSGFAQKILLEQDVNADSIRPVKGPNLKHYSHYYLGYGLVASPGSAGSEIRYGMSSDITLGYRYKRKLSQFYSIGMDISYHLTTYRLKQNSTKRLPNDSLHDKEQLIFHNVGFGIYNRFNYGKRGNYIGNFIDIGARLDLPFSVIHFTKDEIGRAHV